MNPTRCPRLLVERTRNCVGESEDAAAKETKRWEIPRMRSHVLCRAGSSAKPVPKGVVRDIPDNMRGEPRTSPIRPAVEVYGRAVTRWTPMTVSVITLYRCAAGRVARAFSSSLALRRVAKRSDTVSGIAELVTDAIRASGFCGTRCAHVRAWATTDSLRSPPQPRQR